MMEDEEESRMRLLRCLYSLSLWRSTSIKHLVSDYIEPASPVASIVTNQLDALSSSQPCPPGRIWQRASSMHGPPLLVIRRCMLEPAEAAAAAAKRCGEIALLPARDGTRQDQLHRSFARIPVAAP